MYIIVTLSFFANHHVTWLVNCNRNVSIEFAETLEEWLDRALTFWNVLISEPGLFSTPLPHITNPN